MNIILNGSVHPVTDGSSLSHLVSAVTGKKLSSSGLSPDGGRLGVAVARNATVVPRSQWSATALAEGDTIELVSAVQGG